MAAKKSTARSTGAKKATPAKGSASSTENGTTPAKKSGAKSTSGGKKPAKKASTTTPAKKSTTRSSAGRGTTATRAGQLVVREDESPWTAAELKEVRAELEEEIARQRADLEASETELTAFLREPIDGAGDDQADAGAKSFEREHELSLVAGARAGLEQNLHALERLEDGSYGICESCGNPIGKLRLQAYPRATLCMTCKSTQERR
ncbi:TraR/DksA C4-type zinc finger protein [Janibacter cremeus]|uniref:TraR/DksA family transcriptional regulator n=1 Tax=Janibacter cremeus TaxID=1285192 RepID=UPI0023F7AA00|nr:TraR/DksA C4-type zinc finger protein [Janibacter cremeus]WEV78660.1 TraR/DksA C4-type zinc finger protein [Janibacter cremeus]